MPKTDQSIVVRAPARDVFSFVADYRNITRFEKRFSSVELLPGPSHGLGMTVLSKGRFRGVPVRVALRTVEFTPDRRIVSRSVAGLKSVLEWEFTPNGDGTQVRMVASFGWPIPLLPRHVKESIQQEVASMSLASLQALKKILENGDHLDGKDEQGRG